MSVGTKLLQAAAGGGSDPVYVDDVFSTFLYDGTGSSQTINNGIDLSGEGGLVWIKRRSTTRSHGLFDTERGVNQRLYSNLTLASGTNTSSLTAFNSNGFTVGTESDVNGSSETNVAWTFRKAEKFFDIVTWTGSGAANHTINHNLGSTPGMIIWKKTSGADSWGVWHRSFTGYTLLDDTNAGNSTVVIDNVSDTSFRLKYDYGFLNAGSQTYIAYIFGHNEAEYGQNSDEAIIYCDSFTTTSTWGSFKADIGFEPQWIIVKRTDGSSDWVMLDMMRGTTGPGDQPLVDALFGQDSDDQELKANSSDAESTQGRGGFYSKGYLGNLGGIGNANYIYMAIRRPNKPASEFAATGVFGVANATTNAPLFVSGFPVDGGFYHQTTNTKAMYLGSRLQGTKYMLSYSTAAEVTNNDHKWDFMDGWYNASLSSTDYVSYMFRRAKGFFDIVAYVGNGSARTLTHNLGVVPEFMIAKSRTESQPWVTYDAANGATKYARIDSQNAVATYSGIWNDTAPTSSVFSTGGDAYINKNDQNYIIYLFATVTGISKVGSYTGTGSDLNVDCGFSAGARFVLIKRTDSTGDWYVYDSVRGIVAGNDPYFLLNSGAVDVTNTDYIDPLSSGFTITSSAPAGLNASSGTYIFLAIA